LQSVADKTAAIISLLELVYFHVDKIPGAMHVQRYGESEGDPGERRAPLAYNVNCNGRCARCIEAHSGKKPLCPPEEVWAAERAYLRREYRIADVWESLERLSGHEPSWAQAVWTLYVEPCLDPRSECIAPEHRAERDRCAKEGVEWMAHDIRGDVRAFGEKVEPIDNQIRQLASRGLSQRRIAVKLHVGRDRIRRLLSSDPECSSAVYESAVGG
jgi:hypothetical protein